MIEPTNNVEKFLAKIAGDDIETPTPNNGVEYQLNRIAEKEPSPSPGGGGGTLLVTASGDGVSDTLDKSYAEIMAAIASGQNVFIVVPIESGENITGYGKLALTVINYNFAASHPYYVGVAEYYNSEWHSLQFVSDTADGVLTIQGIG